MLKGLLYSIIYKEQFKHVFCYSWQLLNKTDVSAFQARVQDYANQMMQPRKAEREKSTDKRNSTRSIESQVDRGFQRNRRDELGISDSSLTDSLDDGIDLYQFNNLDDAELEKKYK